YRQQVHVVLASGPDRKRSPGSGMGIGDNQQIELRQRLHRFRDTRDAHTGSRYMLSLRPAPTASEAQVVGWGSATTSRSSFGSAFIDSGIRVMLLLACPWTNIARTWSFCST